MQKILIVLICILSILVIKSYDLENELIYLNEENIEKESETVLDLLWSSQRQRLFIGEILLI
jgi:hypothetical protein